MERCELKRRLGYVSNSSSSSFVLVGINVNQSEKYWNQEDAEILEKLGVVKDGDYWDGGYGTFASNHEDIVVAGTGNPEVVGIDVSKMRNDETLGSWKKKFVKLMKKYGVDVSPEKVELIFGEWSSE
jgi:hypothetical protein